MKALDALLEQRGMWIDWDFKYKVGECLFQAIAVVAVSLKLPGSTALTFRSIRDMAREFLEASESGKKLHPEIIGALIGNSWRDETRWNGVTEAKAARLAEKVTALITRLNTPGTPFNADTGWPDGGCCIVVAAVLNIRIFCHYRDGSVQPLGGGWPHMQHKHPPQIHLAFTGKPAEGHYTPCLPLPGWKPHVYVLDDSLHPDVEDLTVEGG